MMKFGPLPMRYGHDDGLLYFERMENGFEIAVINIRGSHPCGYVNVPESFLKKFGTPDLDYDMWFADGAHGGFTYASRELETKNFLSNGFWLGWDYAHLGDYICFVNSITGKPESYKHEYDHEYTTEEVIKDAHSVVETLQYDDTDEFNWEEE